MKAIVVEQFGSTEHMKYADVEIPSIRPNQVLIRVVATCVNYADVKARYGNKGQGKLPFIPGLEAAGIVEQVGGEITSFAIGQRVMAFPHHGSYAEYIAADENLTFAIPDTVSFDVAGSCGIVAFLSYKLLADIAKLQNGDKVLVHSASGGVGTTAIQVAKALGAGTIIGTVGNVNKIPTALEAGADHVICYNNEDFAQTVNELTDGKGVPIILDAIGGEVTAQSMKCLSHYGRLVVFGNSSGEYGQLQTSDLHSSCRSVLGFSLGTTRKERPEALKEISAHVLRMLEIEQVKIKISERLPLKEAAKAHQFIESRNSTGKILLYTEHS
ncbi:quinone oxidoreductase family protein [Paenibacillus albus]|uniref:NADPH:quinone oxidoreductase family protein n=1 Tax=Paenibacillus albus TaxID=2495582 RepID=A0A3Q8X4Y6_9BACL|nr:NADPH:quinone oxidoreductase family protein [Paenibacillus albus]AZN39014.1 NADPH:quinone oxidoreductase family protein [Paenibacillus albus]